MLVHHANSMTLRIMGARKMVDTAIDLYMAGGGLEQTGQHPHECSLSGTILAENDMNIAGKRFKRNFFIGDDATGKLFSYGAELYAFHELDTPRVVEKLLRATLQGRTQRLRNEAVGVNKPKPCQSQEKLIFLHFIMIEPERQCIDVRVVMFK
jgi:hypothetical protein